MKHVEPLIAAILLLAGAVVGYLIRHNEFQRDRRLQAYSSFMGAFLTAAHDGAALYSLAMSLGEDGMSKPKNRDEVNRWFERAGESLETFERATAELRLVASEGVRAKSEELEDFITENVRNSPPYYRGKARKWGASASVGPAQVEKDAVQAAREFADYARPEFAHWTGRGRKGERRASTES